MKKILTSLKTLILALVLGIGVSYISAWTNPTVAPPNGNASAPVNVGATAQVKGGGLGVTAFTADGITVSSSSTTGVTSPKFCIGTSCITTWPSGGTGSGTANYLTKWTGTTSLGNSLMQDNGTSVGVGTAPNATYKLDVNGSMRSSGEVNAGTAKVTLYNQTSEGGAVRLSGNNSVNLTLQNINGLFRMMNSSWTPMFVMDQSGNSLFATGGNPDTNYKVKVVGNLNASAIGIGSYNPATQKPAGWSGGMSTWDLYAGGSVRANTLCLGGTVGGLDTGTCMSSWPGITGVTTYTTGTSIGVHKACFVSFYAAINGGSTCGVTGTFNGAWTRAVNLTSDCRITCLD